MASDKVIRESSTSPPTGLYQLLIIGRDGDFVQRFRRVLKGGEEQVVHVKECDWKSATWQRSRAGYKSWALVALPSATRNDHREAADCTNLVRVTYRPSRLVVMADFQNLDQVLMLVRAGADGVVRSTASPEEVLEEFRRRGVVREEYFPDPQKWLHSLARAASEMDLALETSSQLKKLLRIFVSQLGVDRASIVLFEQEGIRLAAAIGFLREIDHEEVRSIQPGSITDIVMRSKRSRLVLGAQPGSRPISGTVDSAVCAPIMAKGAMLGTVNFSTVQGERQLGPVDLETAEVFASLLGMAINMERLAKKNIESERLAAIGSTMASVSHCLKNLLTIFKGSVGIMSLGVDRQDFGQVAGGLKLVGSGVRRIENLVMDLLDMAKTREPEPVVTNPSALLEEVGKAFSVGTYHKKYSLVVECGVDEAVMLDSFRLQRALMNLLSNSLEAIPDGGAIRLAAAKEGRDIVFSVEDNGNGVPPEDLVSIFGTFFSTKGSSGTGLGLAMVAKFCDENNGRVTADHNGELGGLRVLIRLPYRLAE